MELCASAVHTERLLPVVVVTGTLKETQKSCQAEQTSSPSLILWNLSSAWRTEEQHQNPMGWLLTSAFPVPAPRGLRKALQVALWNCVHQSQGSYKAVLFLSFKQPTHLIYLHWLQIWLASLLTVYQSMIQADEMNRNKEVWKYSKMNYLS